MNFLPNYLIKDDLNRFSKSIQERHGLDHVEVYAEENDTEKVYLGYSFLYQGERIIIKMAYFTNEIGELALDEKNKVWIVSRNGVETTGYQTLGEVFRFLGI